MFMFHSQPFLFSFTFRSMIISSSSSGRVTSLELWSVPGICAIALTCCTMRHLPIEAATLWTWHMLQDLRELPVLDTLFLYLINFGVWINTGFYTLFQGGIYMVSFGTSSSGSEEISRPRLGLLCILRCKANDFGVHYGLKCSSLSKMNRGTSRRSPCASYGYTEYPSVILGNTLIERTDCSWTGNYCFNQMATCWWSC